MIITPYFPITPWDKSILHKLSHHPNGTPTPPEEVISLVAPQGKGEAYSLVVPPGHLTSHQVPVDTDTIITVQGDKLNPCVRGRPKGATEHKMVYPQLSSAPPRAETTADCCLPWR